MTEWTVCKLSDYADVTMGQSPKSEFYNNDGVGYPFLQGNRTFGMKYPTFDTYTSTMTKEAKSGDVIMSVRAPVGDLNITPVDMCLGRGVCGIRAKNNNQDFLFYLMKYVVPNLINKESGTVFGSINRNDINGLEIRIPDPDSQTKIAEILKNIDDKIETNTQINRNLSEQAKVLCKAYFTDYEPFGGECPNDWEVTPLSSIAEFISGYSYKGNELVDESNIAMATIKNFDRNGGFKIDGYKPIVPSGKLKSTQHAELFDTLVAHTDLTQNADVIGNAELVLSKSGYDDIIFSMDLVKVTPKNNLVSPYILAALLHSDSFKQHCLGYVNGTTVLHLSKKALQDYELPLPSDLNELKPLDETLESMYRQMASIMEENTRLIELRDNLLPKLMSGELDVSDLDL